MKVFGLAGWRDSGKTTLMTRLLPELTRRGVTVSTVKHAHHAFDIDQPGKDSYRHREAGASEVLISSSQRWALLHELRDAAEPDLDALLRKMSPVDLVIVEGFKAHRHAKLEVRRVAAAGQALADSDPDVVAIASDAPLPEAKVPVLGLDDIAAIADFIIAHCGIDELTDGVVGVR